MGGGAREDDLLPDGFKFCAEIGDIGSISRSTQEGSLTNSILSSIFQGAEHTRFVTAEESGGEQRSGVESRDCAAHLTHPPVKTLLQRSRQETEHAAAPAPSHDIMVQWVVRMRLVCQNEQLIS